jgi:hypothetical protein
MRTKLERSKQRVYPSARKLLEAGWSCRSLDEGGWAIYWMEGGCELTLFPGGEGPQEASDIDEVIEWIGGDQPCVLTPASEQRLVGWLSLAYRPEYGAELRKLSSMLGMEASND